MLIQNFSYVLRTNIGLVSEKFETKQNLNRCNQSVNKHLLSIRTHPFFVVVVDVKGERNEF